MIYHTRDEINDIGLDCYINDSFSFGHLYYSDNAISYMHSEVSEHDVLRHQTQFIF